MNDVTASERAELYKKWEGKDPIKVTDFQTAVQRSEQMYVQCHKEKVREQQRLYMRKCRKTNPRQQEYDKRYFFEVLSGKRNIPSAKSTRNFYYAITRKYGSVQAYNDIRCLEKRCKG